MIKNFLKKNFYFIFFGIIFVWVYQTISLYPVIINNIKPTVFNTTNEFEVNYLSIDNNKIKTIFFKSHKEDNPVLIYFHGNYELIDHYVDLFNHVREDYDLNILMVEYNGYGDSEGFPSLKQNEINLNKAIEYYKEKDYLQNEANQEYIFFGRSLGTAQALNFIYKNPDYKSKLIMLSGFMSPIDAITNNKYLNAYLSLMIFEDYMAEHKIKTISGYENLKSVVVIHGTEDDLFNIEVAKKMKETFEKESVDTKYIEYEGGHNLFYDFFEDYL
jgi:predicted esterase